MIVISVYTYGVKIIKTFRWESGFLWGGFHGTPPLCTNGSAGYLMQLSVKEGFVFMFYPTFPESIMHDVINIHIMIELLITLPQPRGHTPRSSPGPLYSDH